MYDDKQIHIVLIAIRLIILSSYEYLVHYQSEDPHAHQMVM